MGKKLKIVVLILLILAVAVGIGFLLVNSVRSVSYNANAKNPVVTISVQDYGDIEIELYPDYAPNTVTNFIKLVQNGYYDGKIFYGINGSAVQAGRYLKETSDTELEEGETLEGDEAEEYIDNVESGEEGETTLEPADDTLMLSDIDTSVEADSDSDKEISIEGEFASNEFNENTLRFEYGTVGLYRDEYEGYGYSDLSSYSYNSGSSKFFILTEEDSSLNGMYAAFGKVTKGMDIIEKISKLEKEASDDLEEEEISTFVEFPVMTKVTVETYGIDYGMPKYIDAFDYSGFLSNLLTSYYNQ